MLGRGGDKEFTDLDRVGGAGPSAADAGVGAYSGPTSQNIDLNNLNLDLDPSAPAAESAATEAEGTDHFNSFNEGNGGSPGFEYDYTPTPFNPAKTDRCLVENVCLSVMLALNMVLGIASAATVQLEYKSQELNIQVTAGFVRGCLTGECDAYILPQVFCSRFLHNSGGYLACVILTILLSLFAFIFSICNACGRTFISKYLVIAMTIVTWIFLLTAVICLSTLRTSKLCNDLSLGEIGFKYGPAFPLALTLFLLLSLVILFYFLMRWKRPVRYRYN